MKRIALYAGVIGAVAVLGGLILKERSRESATAAAPIEDASTTSPGAAPLRSTPPGVLESALRTVYPPAPEAILRKLKPNDGGPAFEEFAVWAEGFLAQTGATVTARSEVLAWKRREAMRELVKSDPKTALALRVPYAWRRDLPENVTKYFELQVDGLGDLMVAVASDFEKGTATVLREARIREKSYQAFVYGRRTHQNSKSDIPLHGIAIDNLMAVDVNPVRVLGPAEAEARLGERPKSSPLCSICGRGGNVAGDIGGSVVLFCGGEHAGLVNGHWVAAEDGPSFAPGDQPGTAPWSLGAKRLLYMRVNFPDDLTEPISEERAYAVMDNVNTFYVEGSYNQTAITPKVTPLLTLPQTKGWYSTAGPGMLLADAREAARLAGFETANYALDIACFTSVPDYDWGGLGYVGGKGTWLQSSGAGVTAHELGHNYGLWHGNFWDTGTNFSVIGRGTNVEYGNSFDTMGAAAAGRNHFNANFKSLLDWLPDPAVCFIAETGLCRIYPFDTPVRVNGRFYAARLRRDFDRDYWIEFRERFTSNPWLKYGVMLNWSAWAESSAGTHLLDTTPATPGGKDDGTVVIGRTFSDYPAGVHITPVAQGMDGTNRWIEVQVNSGFFPSNRPPKLRLNADPTNAVPGELVHFQAEATDPDGDVLAYSWFGTSYDTDDPELFSTNNLPWIYRSWSGGGTRVIRCVVSDMKGGVASANAVIRVGAGTDFLVSGHVLNGNGRPVEGVLVTTDPAGDDVRAGYTDSRGQYVIAGIQGELSLLAFKDGYTFTNATWESPVTIGQERDDIDFLALPVPALTIRTTTNAIPESDTSPQYFVLSHSGPTNNDVNVTLNVSGSATVGGDFTLTPALTAGQNTITIPSGTNVVAIRFEAANDATAEDPETLALTLADDGGLEVGVPGEGRITILDDDASARPRVSISSAVERVPEDGADNLTFIIKRLGATEADLPVFYATSGTATAGQDYPNPLGVIVIPAGRLETQLRIEPINDEEIEVDETVTVTLQANASYTLGNASAETSIISDDVLRLTVYPTSGGAAEPSDSGRFTFKREGDLSGELLLSYGVSGTAMNGVDYETLSGTVLIPAGATSAEVTLTPIDDGLLEGDETVILSVTNLPGSDSLAPGSATLVIRDDERTTVTIAAADANASEPGEDYGRFEVSRGSVVNGALVVPIAISGLAANGVDYIPLPNQVVIPDGANTVMLDVIPFDDLHQEPLEDIQVVLLPGPDYSLGTARAVVRITDDDTFSQPAVGFTSATLRFEENRSPGISVSLSATSSAPVTVEYRVVGGTATTDDYSLPDGTLTFEPGNRALSIPLQISNDSQAEPDETVRVVLLNPFGAAFDGIKLHTYTIADDDTSSLSVSATSATASETGPAAGNFRINRSGSISSSLDVIFEVSGTAAAPGDFVPLGGRAVIPAGASFLDLPLIPVDDPTEEFVETVKLTLLNAPGAKIVTPNSATITIRDNDTDTRPVVSVDTSAAPFAVEGGGSGAYTFRRTGPTTTNLTVYFQRRGSAEEGADYTALPESVVIPAGQTSAVLPISAVDDALIEGEETAELTLTARKDYRVAFPSAATVVVQDNDQSVRIDASDLIAREPGTEQGEFTFTRFGTTNTPLQVFFTTSGSALSGVDYTALDGSIVIPAGNLSVTLPVIALDDLLIEGPETVELQLEANSAYTIESATATVTVWDDEPMVTISASVDTVAEGSPDPAVLTVTRHGDPRYEITALLSVGGTASYGIDYPPFTTNVSFTCGIMEIDLLIFPTNELVSESLETVTASLLPHPTYTILTPSNALVNIVDAEANLAPTVTITSPTVDTVFLLSTNANMILEATVSNENTNETLNLLWSKVDGPDTLAFGTNTNANTTVTFTNIGTYVLRLTADDGQLTNYAEVAVNVGAVEVLSVGSLHWTFDEGTGTNVLDSSGASRHGVLSGGFGWVTNGILGGAIELSGAESAAREIPASGFLNGLEAFTLSLWARTAQTNLDQGLFAANNTGTNATLELGRRVYASCGQSTNVIEAVIPTSEGVVRYVSASETATSEWQHIAITWSNGLAPMLYINGVREQPQARVSALEGVLVDSPEFIVGRGSPTVPQFWAGFVDDVRLIPRGLSRWEIGALASLPPTNYGAVVDAGPDVTVQIINAAELAGTVSDDGQPDPPGSVANTWLLVEGPGNVTFTNAAALTNSATFDVLGEYVLRLVADDGQVKTFDDITVTVIEPTQINLFAFDIEAAELGPDTGSFALFRFGDVSIDLPVVVSVGGVASNGVDFLELANIYVFPAGIDFLEVIVTPFLDERIEGNEPLVLTVVSNAAYWIGNAEATITIHDSPYGVWSVEHFTLEELTDPTLSGAGGDFDHDRLINFAEYAANRHPKMPETNSPVVMSIENDPGDGLPYLTIQYPRRLEPTDTTYEVQVSNDLVSWYAGTNHVVELLATDDGNGITETVKARLTVPFSIATNQFVTVKVWLRVTKSPEP